MWICPISYQTVHTRWLQCQCKDEANADFRKLQCCGKSAPSGYFAGELIAYSRGEVGQRAVGFTCIVFTGTVRMMVVCQTRVFAFPPLQEGHTFPTHCISFLRKWRLFLRGRAFPGCRREWKNIVSYTVWESFVLPATSAMLLSAETQNDRRDWGSCWSQHSFLQTPLIWHNNSAACWQSWRITASLLTFC